MKRFIKTAAMAAVSSALVLGGAGVATAGDNGGHHGRQGRHHHGRDFGRYDEGGRHGRGAHAKGFAAHSPGVLSGNVIQIPIDLPINVCGNSIDVIGLLNPAFGNHCLNK
ncbi:chaplin [Streptomyces sp. NPDC056149]|uniref:chaplin n=1 Tax=unclassified Streptomyces TaxID=2593676 RepID=UPI0023817464|nr:chaplin [Streptomyces sp. WZ-12]